MDVIETVLAIAHDDENPRGVEMILGIIGWGECATAYKKAVEEERQRQIREETQADINYSVRLMNRLLNKEDK